MSDRVSRPPQLPSRIADLVAAGIAEGRWKPGERLPAEQALADAYGVSRNVVREAISRLRADGLVQSRQGVGAFVIRKQGTGVLRFDAEALQDGATFRNLFELRAILEIQTAGLAAERRTENDVAAITDAFRNMQREVEGDPGGVDADLAFHRAVARAAANEQIARVISFLSDQVRETIMATRTRPGSSVSEVIAVTIAEHGAIHAAILAGDPAAARNAMATHIRNAASRLGFTLAV
ncbi:FadR family transcriptional regulator [Roseomonas sp. M0104]|uniref:FadR family transcriptional regulator n=1 Tax=Teichococcus coralli TaxID=2545983 RepID=A0A845BG97_9PROT|nr:FadR/GntR family transcriptional regulator [Pseudoroseomonas coralli]MXP65064.1 FadR family transcriptional regulator [Pseudoroseomonas coralli]